MRIFFASDLHGSTRCFRKFLNAARFYKADWLVMGGDAAGKHLVPIIEHAGTWRATFQGVDFEATTAAEARELEARLEVLVKEGRAAQWRKDNQKAIAAYTRKNDELAGFKLGTTL